MYRVRFVFLALLLAGCSQAPAPATLSLGSDGVDGGKDPVVVTSADSEQSQDDRQVRETIARMESQSTHEISTTSTPNVAAAARPHKAVIDASSSQAFANSVATMMTELDTHEREALRYVFVAYNMALAKKVVALQHSGQIKQASDLGDDQVIQLAYGELNGKTFPQALELGRALAHSE